MGENKQGEPLWFVLPNDIKIIVFEDDGTIAIGGEEEFYRSDVGAKIASIPLTLFHVEGILEIFSEIRNLLEEKANGRNSS